MYGKLPTAGKRKILIFFNRGGPPGTSAKAASVKFRKRKTT
jgi:hypothetical protein